MGCRIVTDSSCDHMDLRELGDVPMTVVPFTIRVGEKEWVDDEDLVVEDFLKANDDLRLTAGTACPSPGAWAEAFRQEGDVVALTISSNLSGSYNSACTARDMVLEEFPEKKIEVLDSKSTGPEVVVMARRLAEAIGGGLSFQEIVRAGREAAEKTHVIFALKSFHNLIRNGRVSVVEGFLAGHLGIWGIGIGDEEGKIQVVGKARGLTKVVRFLRDHIEKAWEKTGVIDGSVIISHCLNEEAAEKLKEALLESEVSRKVQILACRGLDCFYAGRFGLIVSY